ncbi:MAG: cytochrome c biogenesis protein ResB, partial [Desulfatibacillaceae bacterium]|nr:cytochrome c biogenesis protein ResB [Desulfatibacillaceae bacterium]
MSTQEKTSNITGSITDFLASVKLSVFLFIILALASVSGTIIPQGQSPEAHQAVFGRAYGFMNAMGFFDVFRAWWFQLVLVLLAANLVVCSLKRLPSTLKVIWPRRPN